MEGGGATSGIGVEPRRGGRDAAEGDAWGSGVGAVVVAGRLVGGPAEGSSASAEVQRRGAPGQHQTQ